MRIEKLCLLVATVLAFYQVHRFNTSKYTTSTTNVDDGMKYSSNQRSSRPVCHDSKHLFKSMDAVEDAYHELEAFHNAGGNLKIIEMYLNDQMDETLDRLDITFTPDGSKQLPSGASITKEIKQLFIKNDRKKRGGYDQRKMPGKYNTHPSNQKALRGNANNNRLIFDVMEPVTDFQRWKKGLGPIPDICHHLDFIKPKGKSRKQSFEEKFMCSLPIDLSNETFITTPLSSSCEMISIGSNGEWGFEESISKTTHCETHTFDCTLPNHEPNKPDISTIHFYPTCISHKYKKIEEGGNTRTYLTYAQTVEKAGLIHPPTLLKMDVEGFEYDVLTQMLVDSSPHLQKEKNDTSADTGGNNAIEKEMLPQQISVELHYATRMFDLPWMGRQRTAAEVALFAGMMYNLGGYVMVHAKYMMGCDSCAEVLFVRVFCD